MTQNKYILLFIWLTLLSYKVKAQYTLIPDSSFEFDLVINGYDDVIDGRVLTANIENVVMLDLIWDFVSDLTGIQDFTALETLYASNNNITILDLSQNTNLKYLDLEYNNLISLDLTGNPNLEYVYCDWNAEILSLDVSQCYSLIHLECPSFDMEVLDVTNSPNLLHLYVGGSNFTTLDLSNNILLEFLDIGSTLINTIDLSNNINLRDLRCGGTNISSLDLSQNINLEYLDIRYLRYSQPTNLTEIDISHNINLKTFLSYENDLVAIDFSNNPLLEFVRCGENNLVNIDLSNNPNLTHIDFTGNDLTSFNVKNGNNGNFEHMFVPGFTGNLNLTCIEVDDAILANNNLPPYNGWHIPIDAVYSEDCTLLSTDENNLITKINLYPNPTTKTFSINTSSNLEIRKVQIYNQLGKQLKSTTGVGSIDVSYLSSGIYYVKIEIEDNTIITKQLIKS